MTTIYIDSNIYTILILIYVEKCENLRYLPKNAKTAKIAIFALKWRNSRYRISEISTHNILRIWIILSCHVFLVHPRLLFPPTHASLYQSDTLFSNHHFYVSKPSSVLFIILLIALSSKRVCYVNYHAILIKVSKTFYKNSSKLNQECIVQLKTMFKIIINKFLVSYPSRGTSSSHNVGIYPTLGGTTVQLTVECSLTFAFNNPISRPAHCCWRR